MSSRVIAVLGMHRSGTSCLTGLLEQAGVFLGQVSKKNPSNLRGNQENPRIMALHDELLRANGGSWDAPPPSITWPQEFKRVRDDIIRGYQGARLWGFKDPRTLLVLDGWVEALPSLEFVGVFRHPWLVAESLQRRNGFPLPKGLELWLSYNEKMLRYRERYRFPVLSFDTAPFTEHFVRVSRSLGLAPVEATLDFFDPQLRHRLPATTASLPAPVDDLYATLNRIAA